MQAYFRASDGSGDNVPVRDVAERAQGAYDKVRGQRPQAVREALRTALAGLDAQAVVTTDDLGRKVLSVNIHHPIGNGDLSPPIVSLQ